MNNEFNSGTSSVNFAQLLGPTYGGAEIDRYLAGAWSMHLPFAWDLTRELRPATFVELGVYRGESYFTFCQSVAANALLTLCHGVDTWEGDIHMGMYGLEIGEEVKRYNSRYASFSKLLTMTFNEALSHFNEGSIDLLHIDGSHRYEDVKEDFEKWLPKVSDNGIILFHDVMVREGDFGVWRLWQQITRDKPNFVFEFGHGLGVWKKNAISATDPPFLQKLFLAGPREKRELTEHYAIAAAALALKKQIEQEREERNSGKLQVFVPQVGNYFEADARFSTFRKKRWCRVKVELPDLQNRNDRIRFDPGDEIAVVDIIGIHVRDRSNGRLLWQARGSAELGCLTVGGTAVLAPSERTLRVLNFGSDPQILLPPLRATSSGLIFVIWLRLDSSIEKIAEGFTAVQSRQQNELQEILEQARQQNQANQAEIEQARQQNQANQAEIGALRSEVERLEREVWDNKVRRADFAARLKERDEWIESVSGSFVWKAAKPLWKLQRHFSKHKGAKKAPDLSNNLIFGLDRQVVWNSTRDSVELKGWCFTRGGPQLVGVRVKIGRKSYFARYGLMREDAAQAASAYPAALYSGFSITIPFTPQTAIIRLEAIAQDGLWQVFLEHDLNSSTDRDAAGTTTAVHKPEPTTKKPVILSIHPNAEMPVLYPNATANSIIPLLAPLIKQHLACSRRETPVFSVITPTFNTLSRWLVEAGASLLNQTFCDWEWCLVDDGSTDSETRAMLESLTAALPSCHIKLVPNEGISSATNQALDMAHGEFVCFLDHDDLLHPAALQATRDKFDEGFDVVYSDEDKLDDRHCALVEPFFKPDWSPEYFRGTMYVGHLLCLRRDLARKIRFDSAFDGVQDFDFMLRVSETGARVGHVSRILYHWRKTSGSIAATPNAKPHIGTLQQNAVNAHLARMHLPAEAKLRAIPHRLKIVPAARSTYPKVSIIIPTRDAPDLLSRCLKSLYENTTYPNYEVLLIDNDTTSREALEVMRKYPTTRVYLANPFNYSRANNLGAQTATGEYLVFLNNDTEVISRHWIDQLLYYVDQVDVGAAGALLLHDNGAVQHGGVILGIRGTADHAMRGFRAKSDGYAGSLSCAREVSAVTAACMMMRKSIFESVGGFNEHFFTIYQDVDLCLCLRERGLRIIWTPQVIFLHDESVSRQQFYDLVDRNLLLDQWEETIKGGDPYYNVNLNVERGDYALRHSS